MPCSDGIEPSRNDARLNYQHGKEVKELENKIGQLEAALCAVFNDLNRRGLTSEVIDAASKSGAIDLWTIWNSHQQQDRERLTSALQGYSKDERDLIFKILSEGGHK